MHQQLLKAAARVASKRRELEQRLQELNEANPFNKMGAARLVASTLFEMFDHQATFNQVSIGAIGELEHRSELLAAKSGCAFASILGDSLPPSAKL